MGVSDSTKKEKRKYFGKEIPNFMELPNLIDIQTMSYKRLLENTKTQEGEDQISGLEEVFRSTFPIVSPNEDMTLEYQFYTLDYENVKLSEVECKRKNQTYAVPLKAQIDLFFTETKEFRRKDIYMGDIPLMTERGTFIINGSERVVVSQIHRSPGVIFSKDNGVCGCLFINAIGKMLVFFFYTKIELI